MTTTRLWALAGGAAVVVVLTVLVLIALVPTATDATTAPTSSASAVPRPTGSAPQTPTATPTAVPTPAPTPVATTAAATCETTSTAAWRAEAATLGWTSWTTEPTPEWGPFNTFPGGSPLGTLICTWGADPRIGTDNVLTLAWARIDPENGVGAMQMLEAGGYTRIESPEGVYLALPGAPPNEVDAEGFAHAYLFTARDVRWAPFKADLGYIKAPSDPE